ncbi:hypothetical protein BGZ99_006837 [Dissophora globulifera]|uniref:FAD-binding FR-type domain-containing protein n=1 Tax=Dissophora globulifera TaxID=979702 RepID=A0A9P6UQL4_9FUNG|nr:hypothetical protein BGZ99_006837 [Dissophora globulifera]
MQAVETYKDDVALRDRWHDGERKIQDLLHVREAVEGASRIFRPYLTHQQEHFVAGLKYIYLGTLDKEGRPWVSMVTGPRGFMGNSQGLTLEVKTIMPPSDPIFANLNRGEVCRNGSHKFGGISIDFTNRRRNKINGAAFPAEILVADEETGELHVRFTVEQTIGNCPKYVTIRKMGPTKGYARHLDSVEKPPALAASGGYDGPELSEEAKAVIHQADCLFLSTRYIDDDLPDQTSGMDCNHRGGNPGFAQLRGNKIIFPDYSGNRFFNSLGNLIHDNRIGLLFVNFDNGDLLHVTGRAELFFGKEAQEHYPHSKLCILVTVDDHFLRKDALPFTMSTKELSPYNPAVPSGHNNAADLAASAHVDATLANIIKHTNDVASFRFITSEPIKYIPGQYAVLDFSQFDNGYSHMRDEDPQSLNDDYIRTWTISSAPTSSKSSKDWQEVSEFTLTIKRKPGGLMSNVLHDFPLKRYKLMVPLVTTGGSFLLPKHQALTDSVQPDAESKPFKVAFISGGIGSTPFISMIRGARHMHDGPLDIKWVNSATTVDEALPQILREVAAPLKDDDNKTLDLSMELFVTREKSSLTGDALAKELLNTRIHYKRVGTEDLLQVVPDLLDRQIFICGPDPFMDAIKVSLEDLKVSSVNIHFEAFNF